jgi:formate dehydrogenase beta subunit
MQNLLHDLHELQERHGWLSEDVLRAFSRERNVPLHRLEAVTTFYPHYRRSPPPRATVAVCRDASCRLGGGAQYVTEIRRGLAGAEGVEVREVSCLGRCEHAPAACVNDVPLESWSAADVVAAASGKKPMPPDEPTSTPRRWPTDPYAAPDAHYGALRRALAGVEEARRTIPQVLKDAGLRGMGGAGFPTGMKWSLVRDALGDETGAAQSARDVGSGASAPPHEKYAIVNADESEPGTFKDRVILEELPHLVIEGLLLGCLVTGARTGIVYIRHEYTRETKAIRREIDRVRALGLLSAPGFGRPVELSVFVSPGGYILGEETALLEALEGNRGEPRNKPPYPVTHGLFGKPTLMNNVETYSFVPAILTEGAEAWKAHGVNGGTGWKFLSVSGHVAKPGVYCVPMGTTVRELVERHCGGMKDGRAMRAFSPGGASAPFLPASAADTPLTFDAMAKAGSMLGSGAPLVVAEGTDLLDLATNLVRFFRNESCGKCVPCRVGSEKAVTILDRMVAGQGTARDLALLPELDETLRLTSICGLGQVALNPAMSVLKHFPDEARRPARA